ncbi:MAG: glycosyltransferase family 39 protein [Terracidiphilus sp.]|nr:glycosyltransferase family 39 protein [Terracidiphilus sp.]
MPWIIALAVALVHIFTNYRYGFHRDELQFLSDARHLDWGYVPYPPLTAFVQYIALSLFGLSLTGLRLFSVFAQSVAIGVTGMMAAELGGGRRASLVAALAVAFSPLSLFEGTEFQYTTFDYLWWMLAAFFVLRALRTENPRWWLAVGAVLGLGLLTKYSIVFYIAGILAGILFTCARRWLRSAWFWAAAALALLIFLPNLLWLAHHNFISYQFLQHIHARDVAQGRAAGFLSDQFLLCVNLAAAPLWIAGLIAFIVNRRYRIFAWMWTVPVAFFAFNHGRGYYTAAAYPILLAMGAVVFERWLIILPQRIRRTIQSTWLTAFAVIGAYACAIILPLASSGPLRQFALSHNGDLREEIGWEDLVQTVAQIRDSLPASQRASLGIVTANYGEYGAIDVLGPRYGLPAPIGTTNSEWERGYPTPQPTTLIVLGLGSKEANALFTGCRFVARNANREGIRNEESQRHPEIFLCGPPRKPWAELWLEHRDFG